MTATATPQDGTAPPVLPTLAHVVWHESKQALADARGGDISTGERCVLARDVADGRVLYADFDTPEEADAWGDGRPGETVYRVQDALRDAMRDLTIHSDALPVLRWVASKLKLSERDLAATFTFSKDVNVHGAKMFAVAPSAHAAARYLSAHPGSPLNEVLVDRTRPLHGVCDCDRPDTVYKTGQVVADLLAVWSDFFEARCGFKFRAVLGFTCEVSTASTLVKTSVHVKFDFVVESMIDHLELALQLVSYAIEHRASYPSLVWDDCKNGASTTRCVIDTAIYTSFRSWRQLGMTKLGKDNALVPFPGCSDDPIDHFVGIYDGIPTDHLPRVVVPKFRVPKAGGSKAAPRRARASESRPVGNTTLKAPAEYGAILNAWPSTREAFDGSLDIVAVQALETPGTFRLRTGGMTVCPYVGRPHASNHVYVWFDTRTHRAKVYCHDEKCEFAAHETPVWLKADRLPGDESNAHDAQFPDTLHNQQEAVEWTEVYVEEDMRDLPLSSVVSAQGGMGTGKTKAIVRLLRLVCGRKTKVLVVSYSRALCGKYKATFDRELPQIEFTCYLEVQGPITAERVIVCLDSITRVDTCNFDFVIIDEAASVLQHFNSHHMENSDEITNKFELQCQHAKHVYFLDAVVDSTAVRSVIDYFARYRGTVSYNVWNKYVRPTNRAVELFTCDPDTPLMLAEQTLMRAALERIDDLLKRGKNVVVPTSTKSFAKVVEAFLAERYPELAEQCRVYHSDTKAVNLATIDEDWTKLRALVYSPSITAGVSYEKEHFHECVAYFVSSPHTPTVELALQQLYRVRDLADGRMSVYVHVMPPPPRLPTTAIEIGAMLTEDVRLLNRLYGTKVSYKGTQVAASQLASDQPISFDSERLSYCIILGIIGSINRSLVKFVPLMRETLTTDYHVPVTETSLPVTLADSCIDIAQVRALARGGNVPYDSVEKLTEIEFSALKERLSDATTEQQAAARLFKARMMWGIQLDNELLEEFYKKYVIEPSGETYLQVKRLRDVRRYSFAENQGRMRQRVDDVMAGVDSNMALYKSTMKDYFSKLLIFHQVFEDLLSEQERAQISAYKEVKVGDQSMESAMEVCLRNARVDDEDLVKFKKLFATGATDMYTLFTAIMIKGGGVAVTRQKKKDRKHAAFRILILHATKEQDIVQRHKALCPWMSC